MFADCIAFYDDWGSGDDVKLDVYYRMCDQLVQAIKKSDALMATDASRFCNGWGEDPETMHPDPEKHILAFDLIYCCSAYGLFDGISFDVPKLKERQLMRERKQRACELQEAWENAVREKEKFEEAKKYVNLVYAVGTELHHSQYGDGIIKENSGARITVDFPGIGEKKLGTFISAAKGIISADVEGYADHIAEYKYYLEKESAINSRAKNAEQELAPYAEYLE